MPWMYSKDLNPPLTSDEREKLADGGAIVRQVSVGFYVVSPRSIVTSYGIVTGCGVTYGPNDENTFFHHIRAVPKVKDKMVSISNFLRGVAS
mgnify:CR=1 FL=1